MASRHQRRKKAAAKRQQCAMKAAQRQRAVIRAQIVKDNLGSIGDERHYYVRNSGQRYANYGVDKAYRCQPLIKWKG